MKRFKTKQEFKNAGHVCSLENPLYVWLKENSLWGLSIKNEIRDYDEDLVECCPFYHTTAPHPFDSMDIKVRVTPKQSKKLQKKAFKMGYGWLFSRSPGVNIPTNKEHWIYIRGGRIDGWNFLNPNYHEGTEISYKAFMNGTVPKKKKFEVGDWVEVVDKRMNHCFKIGDIIRICGRSCSDENMNATNDIRTNHVSKKDIIHTGKRPEEKLMFKGHIVNVTDDRVVVGCKNYSKSELNGFIEVMNGCIEEDIDPSHASDFIIENKSKLEL